MKKSIEVVSGKESGEQLVRRDQREMRAMTK